MLSTPIHFSNMVHRCCSWCVSTTPDATCIALLLVLNRVSMFNWTRYHWWLGQKYLPLETLSNRRQSRPNPVIKRPSTHRLKPPFLFPTTSSRFDDSSNATRSHAGVSSEAATIRKRSLEELAPVSSWRQSR